MNEQDKASPLREQYLKLKAQYPDTILFFRLGDFYETFDEDAELAAQELDLVLTSRPFAKGVRAPMAGVPHHAVESYIARLIEKGYRVAIAEQVGESTGRGPMERQVERVVTPGTLIEPTLLDERRPNYLAAVIIDGERAGVAYADISTGEFATTQISDGGDLDNANDIVMAVRQELTRLQAREVLIPEVGSWKDRTTEQPVQRLETALEGLIAAHFTPWPVYRFDEITARQALLEHFEVRTLQGFGCEGKPLAIRAAGAVLTYLQDTQQGLLPQIVGLSTYATDHFMAIDAATWRNLEITETLRGQKQGSLLGVIDATLTPMGGRLLLTRLAQALLDIAELETRLEQVQGFVNDGIGRAQVREILKQVPDLERMSNRVLAGKASPRDLIGIRKALETVPALREELLHAKGATTSESLTTENGETKTQGKGFAQLLEGLEPVQEVVALITEAIVDDPPAQVSAGGLIRPGFSTELDGILVASKDAREWIASLESKERARTGIKSLKVGYNRVFGYYLEVTKANISLVPDHYIRKQTLVNSERYITPELKEYESLVLNAEERISELETRLFHEICQRINIHAVVVLATAQALARVDVAAALAEVAVRQHYTRPTFAPEPVMRLYGGRHPVVERAVGRFDNPFTPNDLEMDTESRIHIITGPNMAGKSVFLRQSALIVLLAQIGSFVPADEAHIGVVDRIFTRIGASDELAAGQSTFMVEMVETANILHHATPQSLLILDEVGRGTSTYDGMAIAWAVIEYLHNHPERRARTLFATHYHELIEMEEHLPHIRNFNLAVAEEGKDVVFLHKVVAGGADRSYGIHVARLAGIPAPVIHRAETLLQQLESGEFRPGTEDPEPFQPMLIAKDHPIVEELRALDINSLTPLDALTKLYTWQKQVQQKKRK
ncbi:MAG: DNA mismatch repair protein MutS [Anaerolineae bacterium]|nr:DNA mismatch repair protein MutS [Anaerolineae bacterium]